MATAVVTAAMLRTCAVRLEAMEFTESVRSFHVPATPLHIRLTAEFSFGADFAGHTRDFRGKQAELIDHRIDGVFEFQEFHRAHQR